MRYGQAPSRSWPSSDSPRTLNRSVPYNQMSSRSLAMFRNQAGWRVPLRARPWCSPCTPRSVPSTASPRRRRTTVRDQGPAKEDERVDSMLGLEKSSLSGLVDRVAERGLLRRNTTRPDGRAVALTPATRGKRVTEAFNAEVSDRLLEVIAHLTASDRQHFERIATRIVLAESVPAVLGSASALTSRAARA